MTDEMRKKGEVVIQRVERDPAQVTRRYVVLVLSPAAEPSAAPDVVEALQRALPGLVARREGRGEGDGSGNGNGNGNGDRPALDLRAGVALQGSEATAHLEFYAFADCPWFDRDAPPGAWGGVYELVSDVSLRDKERDARFRFLSAAAHALGSLCGGAMFDLQEWRLVPPPQ